MKAIWMIVACLGAWMPARAYEMIEGALRDSRVYPGAEHSYSVSVPAGYDASSPACLYVGLDGPLYNAPAVIDSLIAAGAMPMTIGVYFQPGVIKDARGETVRYNRSNEYDAVDGRLAYFIAEELLPAVRQLRTAQGLPIVISDDPDAHAISGASSGGIGAFVAAWQRPDLFRRVYTTCGTFVSMRGGDLLPALARKTEPLPLRIFMHDGSRDAWNPLFGHWYEQNRLLASSLQFAGYDLDTRWDDTGHSIAPGTKYFPEAMAWLWRDYPAKIHAGATGNDCLQRVLAQDSGWRRVEGIDAAPAPTRLLYPNGEYAVRAVPGSQWIEAATVGADGTPGLWQPACLLHDLTFADPGVTGMAFDVDGYLYVATSMGIQVADQNGRVRAILRYPVAGKPQGFAYAGHTLYVMIDGVTYARDIAPQAAPAGTRIDVPSQGPS